MRRLTRADARALVNGRSILKRKAVRHLSLLISQLINGLQTGSVYALVALGYSSTDALRAVRKVTDVAPDDVEGLLKAALKNF